MPFAVLNLHSRSVEIDHADSYAIAPDGPRFVVTPLDTGDGPAIFPEYSEAEAWRGERLAELDGQRSVDA